jgi:TolA-binding protein
MNKIKLILMTTAMITTLLNTPFNAIAKISIEEDGGTVTTSRPVARSFWDVAKEATIAATRQSVQGSHGVATGGNFQASKDDMIQHGGTQAKAVSPEVDERIKVLEQQLAHMQKQLEEQEEEHKSALSKNKDTIELEEEEDGDSKSALSKNERWGWETANKVIETIGNIAKTVGPVIGAVLLIIALF